MHRSHGSLSTITVVTVSRTGILVRHRSSIAVSGDFLFVYPTRANMADSELLSEFRSFLRATMYSVLYIDVLGSPFFCSYRDKNCLTIELSSNVW